MKEMLLYELMYFVIIVELGTTLLEMLDPIEACVLNLRRKVLFHSTAFKVSR